MTEFVIGLPVFVLIFGGILMLYNINNEALRMKGMANSDLWANADLGAGDIIPIAAAAGLFGAQDFNDVAQNGASALGIYADSGVKTMIPLTLLPGTDPSSPCFLVGCALGGVDSDYMSHVLLDDNMVNGIAGGNLSAGGWANIVSSALTISGSRPAFVAGIRYGAVEGESQTASVTTPMFGDVELESGKLDVPGITQPTHRSLAVLVTRVEFARDEVWNKQLPEFDEDFDTGDSSVAAGQEGECNTAVTNYQGCMGSGAAGESQEDAAKRCEDQAPGDACGSLGSDNPLPSVSPGWSP